MAVNAIITLFNTAGPLRVLITVKTISPLMISLASPLALRSPPTATFFMTVTLSLANTVKIQHHHRLLRSGSPAPPSTSLSSTHENLPCRLIHPIASTTAFLKHGGYNTAAPTAVTSRKKL
ncbi:hypothetical protein BD410DRAFT_846350 [Rickenella mellea]|uniref:Uncharacterized protein n=1 Tax=Rickenella mellea TaxID=50990 RepID=A0A4Y7PFE4_9AGAM|nr:hypothetical protein BD410DRAFT_846350 [Rickenella mellea]